MRKNDMLSHAPNIYIFLPAVSQTTCMTLSKNCKLSATSVQVQREKNRKHFSYHIALTLS